MRLLILQRRPILAGIYIYIYIYLYVAIVCHIQECRSHLGMQLPFKVNAHAMVQPCTFGSVEYILEKIETTDVELGLDELCQHNFGYNDTCSVRA